MKCSVFGKKIKLDDDLVQEYTKIYKLDELTLRYLAKTSGASEKSTARELQRFISEGMREEITVYYEAPRALEEYFQNRK